MCKWKDYYRPVYHTPACGICNSPHIGISKANLRNSEWGQSTLTRARMKTQKFQYNIFSPKIVDLLPIEELIIFKIWLIPLYRTDGGYRMLLCGSALSGSGPIIWKYLAVKLSLCRVFELKPNIPWIISP